VKSTARIVNSGTATATTVFDREGENILPQDKDMQCERTIAVNGNAVAEVAVCADDAAGKSQTIASRILGTGHD